MKKPYVVLVPTTLTKDEKHYTPDYYYDSEFKTEKEALSYQKEMEYQESLVVKVLARFDMAGKRRKN